MKNLLKRSQLNMAFCLYLGMIFSYSLTAQNAFMPEDYYPNEKPSQERQFYPNQGQLLNTAGDIEENVLYYNVSGTARLFLMEEAVAFTSILPAKQGDPDTLLRVDMKPYKLESNTHLEAYYPSSDHLNFYFPHCSLGITNIHGYDRMVYENYFEGIDLHITSNKLGGKMFFVVHPEADVS